MRLHDAPLECLRDAVGSDESESLHFTRAHEFGGFVPPIHDEISLLLHVGISCPECFHISVTHHLTQNPTADEWWIANNEIGLWPLGLMRICVDRKSVV